MDSKKNSKNVSSCNLYSESNEEEEENEDWENEESGFDSYEVEANCLFFTSSRPAVKPIQTLVKSGRRLPSRSVKLVNHLHLMPRLNIRGYLPSLSHTSSLRGTPEPLT
jgi:hypothetical protein